MQIAALSDIVEGKLLNTPAVSFVTQIHTNLSKVNDGDAFFAIDLDDAKTAIQKGAFGIIVDKILLEKLDLTTIDNEIAWIYVDDIIRSIKNIIRYTLINKSVSSYALDSVSCHLVELFKTKENSNITIVKNDIFKDFETLLSIEENSLIFGSNIEFMKFIDPNCIFISKSSYQINNLIKHTLFETSFSYEDILFQNIKLPILYINNLLEVLDILPFKVDLKKISNFKLFKPIFINKSAQIVPHGQTNRFIVSNNNISICEIEIAYLKKEYSYANIDVINRNDFNNEELFDHIKNRNYNALYIKGEISTNILKILQEHDSSLSLF